jgi:hypothetical protein
MDALKTAPLRAVKWSAATSADQPLEIASFLGKKWSLLPRLIPPVLLLPRVWDTVQQVGWHVAFWSLQGGCIIRASFLDEIKQAYERDPALENLLMDEYFAKKLVESQDSWRCVIKQAIDAGLFLHLDRCVTCVPKLPRSRAPLEFSTR